MTSLEAERVRGQLQHANETAMLRAELNDTLSQLQDRLNVSKRIDEAVDDAKVRVVDLKRRRPTAFIAGVVGVAAIAGLLTWNVVRKVAVR
ncbi:DUF3618 domain-containing protein [Leucobacter sp. M11]|uniref:DUF3618 domain-containing protein n=1 Tax=Leucobacter sp. M11 TaxID=2993565 RepID=UPI002D7EB802|nr:DUF3618 domain-containing protein [Leucobacter sp. M11]MEB4615046.1 DUF3618 domain-containing protein [Leucobacter sp. M11]